MIRRLSLVLVIFFVSSGAAEDRRSDTSKLKVMCLNAEFLWDGVDPEEGQVDFGRRGNLAAANKHMEGIADIIKAHNPDMVCLVEVEGLDALRRLNDQFLSDQRYAPFLKPGRDTFTGQDVGLLTRVDPTSFHYDDRTGSSEGTNKRVTKNCVAEFEVNSTKIALIGVHLLARPTSTGRRKQRQAQADAIRAIALEKQAEGRDLIILGDFNDFSDKVDDVNDSEPISKVMMISRMMQLENFDDDLKNVAQLVAKSDRYTSHFDRNRNGRVDTDNRLSFGDGHGRGSSETQLRSLSFSTSFSTLDQVDNQVSLSRVPAQLPSHDNRALGDVVRRRSRFRFQSEVENAL